MERADIVRLSRGTNIAPPKAGLGDFILDTTVLQNLGLYYLDAGGSPFCTGHIV